MLLTGDIEGAAEAALLARTRPTCGADVWWRRIMAAGALRVAGFVAAVRPREVIFPVGYRNRFGHPAPEVLERYPAGGAEHASHRQRRCGHRAVGRDGIDMESERAIGGATGTAADRLPDGGVTTMSDMRQHTVQCLSPAGFHHMAYVEWGDPDNPRVLVCVHGLTRCGRDFDFLAQALADRYRVVCPDVVGRGRSDWLREQAALRHSAVLRPTW